MGSWVTPPVTGYIEIEGGGREEPNNQPWVYEWPNKLPDDRCPH